MNQNANNNNLKSFNQNYQQQNNINNLQNNNFNSNININSYNQQIEQQLIESNKKPNKKLFLIIGSIALVLIVVGSIIGFNIYKNNEEKNKINSDILISNQLYNDGTDDHIIVKTSKAIACCNGIDKLEPYSPEKSFMDAIKGLNTYGAKVVRPKELYVIKAHR